MLTPKLSCRSCSEADLYKSRRNGNVRNQSSTIRSSPIRWTKAHSVKLLGWPKLAMGCSQIPQTHQVFGFNEMNAYCHTCIHLLQWCAYIYRNSFWWYQSLSEKSKNANQLRRCGDKSPKICHLGAIVGSKSNRRRLRSQRIREVAACHCL